MADYIKLKDAITEVIKTNGNQEITGQILQNTLLSIVNVIGEDRTFSGVAEPDTNPGNPDQNVIWAATQKGTYTGFGNYVHDGVGIAFLGNTTSGWQAVKMNVVGVDSDGNPVNPDSYVTKEAFEKFKKDLVAELTDTSDANNIHARFDSHGNVIFDYYATKQSVDALIKEIGSESTSESEDGSVWGKLISLVQDTTVLSKEISDLNDESDNLQADMTKVKSDISKLDEDMDNAYTQNGCLFCHHGMVNINFYDDNVSINFPSQVAISYSDTLNVVHNQGDLSMPYDFEEWFLVLDLEDNKLKLVSSINQMTKKVLVGWINVLLKSALLRCSDYSINGKPMNPTKYLSASEILNVITSTATDLPLSANMGRILSTQNAMMQYTVAGKYVDVNFSSTDTSVTVTLPSGLLLSYGNTRISESSSTEGTVLTDNMSSGRIKYLVYDLGTSAYKLVNFDEQMNNSILVGWINQYLKEAILKCDRYRVDGVSQSPDDYIQNSDIVHNLTTTDKSKVLGADQAGVLATQNGFLFNRSTDTLSVVFDIEKVTIKIPQLGYVTYGNSVVAINLDESSREISAQFNDFAYKFFVYDINNNQFGIVDYRNQLIPGIVLLGYINSIKKTADIFTQGYTVDGVSRSFADYLLKSDVLDSITSDDAKKALSASRGKQLSTQNGWLFPREKGIIHFESTSFNNITLKIDGRYSVSWGNSVFRNEDTSLKNISASGFQSNRFLVYDIESDSFSWEEYGFQMKGVLLGWYDITSGNVFLRCSEYSVNGMPASNDDLAEIAYNNIPTTVIQLKKNSDEGFISMVMTSPLIDSEINITGGYVSLSTNIGTETSVKIKKGVSNSVYFKCIDPFAVIEAKGVYNITNNTQNNNCYVIGNVRDFGEGATHISLSSNNNVTGEIKDFNRKMTYILINSGPLSNPKLSGKLEDLPRLLTYLRLTSAGISITGNVSDLPRKLTYMYLNTGSPIDMSGDVSDLPRSLEQIILYGLTDIFTGDVSDFPRGLINVMLVGSNYIISGNVSDLPPNLDTLQISGASTVSGNILDLPRRLTNLYLVGKCNLKGSLADLPKNINYLSFQSTDSANPITGDISDIPNKKVAYLRLYQNLNITFNGEFPMSDQVYYFQLQPSEVFPIDSATVDNILIKLAAIAGERTGTRTINLTGACAAPTEASQSAIESLQQKGFTVTTNK
ncbi:hypothetical protein [Bacteroides salyersiae]|uniref:hypothetical protein n=1 Tax=Bacteroides salyersiae TaxID=291644 RepID=UPI0003272101|nr:hypothetical protein [Bacteroides salyersiae]EOA48977.1 hypothetical protein HMPREF1532_02611 [Bacteroides salyersiae WAL 10018 = DSM 18765 = JCM 12988]